jgi:hypothetical protein
MMSHYALRLEARHEHDKRRRGRARRPQVIPLENRDLLAIIPLAGPLVFDFRNNVNTGTTNPIQVSLEKYTVARGYGWTALTSGMASGSFVVGRAGTFSVALPNGNYEVVATVGGSGNKLGVLMKAEGQAVPRGMLAPGASLPTFSFKSHVTDGVLDMEINIESEYSNLYIIDNLEIRPIAAAPNDANAQAIGVWRSQMLQYGRKYADWLIANQDGAIDPPLSATFYDAARIFYQIADDTGDPYWLGAAKVAVKVYRDRYVLPNNGRVPGYWDFARGLADDFRRTGDVASRNAVMMLSENAAYSSDVTPLARTVDQDFSREVAYSLSTQIEAELLGAARRPRTVLLAEQAMGHIDQWTATRDRGPAVFVRPFMVALTAEALIRYQDLYKDPRVLPKVTQALDWIWKNTWDPASSSFKYTDIDTTTLPHAADPTTPAAVNPIGGGVRGGGLAAGTYTVSYTLVTAVGETLASPPSARFEVAAGSIPRITLPAVPAGSLSLSVYLTRSGEPSGATRYSVGLTTTNIDLRTPALASASAPPKTSNATSSAYNTGGTSPTADLNLLIAPAYAWVYQRTGNVAYREKADAIFAGGVKGAWLGNAKHFNQNYRWSFDYIKWRSVLPGSF